MALYLDVFKFSLNNQVYSELIRDAVEIDKQMDMLLNKGMSDCNEDDIIVLFPKGSRTGVQKILHQNFETIQELTFQCLTWSDVDEKLVVWNKSQQKKVNIIEYYGLLEFQGVRQKITGSFTGPFREQ